VVVERWNSFCLYSKAAFQQDRNFAFGIQIFLNINGLNVPAEDPNDSGIRCKYGNDSPNPNYTGLIVGMVAGIIFAGVLYAVFVHYRDKSKETNPSEIYLLQQNIADTRS
jgi:hypothetical protein